MTRHRTGHPLFIAKRSSGTESGLLFLTTCSTAMSVSRMSRSPCAVVALSPSPWGATHLHSAAISLTVSMGAARSWTALPLAAPTPIRTPSSPTPSASQTSTINHRQFSSTSDAISSLNGTNTQLNSRDGGESVSAQHRTMRASRVEALSFLDTIAAPYCSRTTGIVTQNQSRSDGPNWRRERQSSPAASRSHRDGERNRSRVQVSRPTG